MDRIVRQWIKEVHLENKTLYIYKNGVLSIYSVQPGILIGVHGYLFNKYENLLKEINGFIKIEIFEAKRVWK